MAVHVGGKGPGHLARSPGFYLPGYMASQSDGFWFDLRRRDSMFQQSVGPTPADDPGEPIGLALDQRLWGGQTLPQVVAGAAELVANGDFATNLDGWTDADSGTGESSWLSGSMRLVGVDTSNRAIRRQTLTTVAGRRYQVSVDASVVSSSGQMRIGTTVGGTELLADTTVPSGAPPLVRYFTATTTSSTISLQAISGEVLINSISVREVSRHSALQATDASRPTFGGDSGASFNGTAHNLLTGYTAGSGANFLVARVTVPASIAATQAIMGVNAAANEACRIAVATTGALRVAVGTDSALDSTGVDLRGRTVVVGLTFDGSSVRWFSDGSIVGSVAQNGLPNTTIPLRIGANNSNGTAGSFFGGSIQTVLAGREFLDEARFRQIANALAA
jgi:hypothetical protein